MNRIAITDFLPATSTLADMCSLSHQLHRRTNQLVLDRYVVHGGVVQINRGVTKVPSARVEVVASVVGYALKNPFSQAEQADVGLQEIAVGDTFADGQGSIAQGFEFGGRGILNNQSQTCVRTEGVGGIL